VRPPRRPTVIRLGAVVAAGALSALSRPPFDLGPLACVSLVPLFLAWRSRGVRASAGYGFLAGAVYYGIVCSWIWYFGTVAIIPFVAACAAYWAAAGAVIGWFRTRGVANPFLVAAVWVIADAGVARFPVGGLSWGELGYAFHDLAPARAVASIGGLTFVTFLAVAFNAFVADLVLGGRTARQLALAYVGIAAIAATTVLSTVYRSETRNAGVLRVALVQGNDLNRDLTLAEEDARYLPKSHFDLAENIRDPVDLIVFPESSMDEDPRTDRFVHDQLARIAREHDAYVLANATVDAPPDGSKAENLNVLFGPDGEILGTYSKQHLVPFGEYVPLRNLLEDWIPALDDVPRDFVPGKMNGLFDVANARVGSVICFESAFGRQVRDRVRDGAEVIVVSTNNRSYRRSANSDQHVAIGQIRAAETGRPIVHSAISGVTAVIDSDGVVHERTELFDRALVETVVAGRMGQTTYVRYGEWVLWGSIVGVAITALVVLVRRRRAASVDSPSEVVSVASRLDEHVTDEQPAHENV
jgi:apolipoprotein N-acyltransferase